MIHWFNDQIPKFCMNDYLMIVAILIYGNLCIWWSCAVKWMLSRPSCSLSGGLVIVCCPSHHSSGHRSHDPLFRCKCMIEGSYSSSCRCLTVLPACIMSTFTMCISWVNEERKKEIRNYFLQATRQLFTTHVKYTLSYRVMLINARKLDQRYRRRQHWGQGRGVLYLAVTLTPEP